MNLRELTPNQVQQLQKECLQQLATYKLSHPDVNTIDFKLAWSKGAQTILKKVDLPAT